MKQFIIRCNDKTVYLLPLGTHQEEAEAAARRLNDDRDDDRKLWKVDTVKCFDEVHELGTDPSHQSLH